MIDQLIFGGLPVLADFVLLALRLLVGAMFAISGYYKLFDAEEHARMTDTLAKDGIPRPADTNWVVSACELLFGIALILGLFTGLSALVLLVIIVVAYLTDGYYRRPESERFLWWLSIECMKHQPLIAALLLVAFVFGPGDWALDAWLR